MNRLEVKEQVITCTRCELHTQCKAPVPFRGPAPARIAIVGEAPGAQEDEQGKPFIGPAGGLLAEMLAEIGVNHDDCCIFNTVQCFPHGTPNREHVEACKVNKVAQLVLAQPEVVLILGSVALTGFRSDLKIGQARGRPFKTGKPNSPLLFATYHPAAALRKGLYAKEMRADLQKFKVVLERGMDGWDIGDTCISCTAPWYWCDETGIPWCEKHMPEEGHTHRGLVHLTVEASRERLRA